MAEQFTYNFIIKFLKGFIPPTPPTPPDPPIPPDPPVPPVPPEPVPPTPVDPGTGSITATGDLTLSIVLICLAVAICAFCAFIFIRNIRKTYGVANVKTIASLSFSKISLAAKMALIAIPLTILLTFSMLCYSNAYANNSHDDNTQVVYAWVYDDSIVIDPVYIYAPFEEGAVPFSFTESAFGFAEETNPDIVDYENMLIGSWLTVSGLDGTIFTGWANNERIFHPQYLDCFWPGQFAKLSFELSGVDPFIAHWLLGQDVFAVSLHGQPYNVQLGLGTPDAYDHMEKITDAFTGWEINLRDGKTYPLLLWQPLHFRIIEKPDEIVSQVKIDDKEIYPDWFGVYTISPTNGYTYLNIEFHAAP